MITEFVLAHRERPFESAADLVDTVAGAGVATVTLPAPELPMQERQYIEAHAEEPGVSVESVESLPSITDFMVAVSGSEVEHEVEREAEVEQQAEEAIHVAEGEGMPAPLTEVVAADSGEIVADSPTTEETAAREIDQHPSAQGILAQETPIQALPAEQNKDQPLDSGWVNDERNAFDWQAMAALATKQDDEHTATDEWASTNWEPSHSNADHVAAILIQIARRVKAGELVVAATRDMTTEATLAATLMALLQTEV